MKKLIFTAAALSLVLAACGDKKDEDGEGSSGPSVCDCVKMGEEMAEKMSNAEGEEALDKIEAEYKDQMDACQELADGMSEEEMEEASKEAENCD